MSDSVSAPVDDSTSVVPDGDPVGVPVAAPAVVPAGTLLREAREAQGMHIAALAVALKVPVRKIEALEEDRLDMLPDLVFARALAGSVCRQLKLDPKPVLDRLPQGQPRLRKEREPINEPFRTPARSNRPSWRAQLLRPPVLVALALLLGAIVLLALPLLPGGQGTVQVPVEPTAAKVTPVAPPAGVVTETMAPAPALVPAPAVPVAPAAASR